MKSVSYMLLPHPQFIDRDKLFFESYELIDFIANDDVQYSKRSLTRPTERLCRFCGKSQPEVRFSNLSHLIPKLIGNGNLYSNFECDNCNERFSKIEDHLARFLGVSRSVTGLGGIKMAKGFYGERLYAKSRSFIGNNILILAPQDIEKIDNTTILRYIKSFVPANVYKTLLKSAISLLDKNTVDNDYETSIEYLNGKIKLDEGALITGYRYSLSLNLP